MVKWVFYLSARGADEQIVIAGDFNADVRFNPDGNLDANDPQKALNMIADIFRLQKIKMLGRIVPTYGYRYGDTIRVNKVACAPKTKLYCFCSLYPMVLQFLQQLGTSRIITLICTITACPCWR